MNQSNWNKKVINRREQVRYENTSVYKSKGYVDATCSSDSKKSHHKKRRVSHNFFSSLVSMIKKRKEKIQLKENSSYGKIKKEAKTDIGLGIGGIMFSIWLLLLIKVDPVSGTSITFGFILLSAVSAVMLLTDGISSLLTIRKGKRCGIVKERYYFRLFLGIYLFAFFLGFTLL